MTFTHNPHEYFNLEIEIFRSMNSVNITFRAENVNHVVIALGKEPFIRY